MRSVNFSSDNLAVQWQYVKRNLREMGILYQFDDFEEKAQRVVQKMIQSGIYEEFAMQIGAERYERSARRISSRKGEYQRDITTTFGRSRISIPRARGGIKIRYELFEKYQRRQKKFDDMILLSMLLGLSTRKQRKFFQSFIGDAVSHTAASRLLGNLEGGLREFRTSPIEDKYKYLLVDGIWVSIKEDRVRKRVILFVLGVTEDNKKELIGFRLARGETEQEVTSLLNDLYRRGLEGKHLRCVTSDGSKGIRAGIQMVYPYSKWQLCYTHKLRNVSKNIRYKQKHHRNMMRQAKDIYKAKSKREAISRFNKLSRKWADVEPHAVKCLENDFHASIVFYDYAKDKRLMSTSNHLERVLEEIRRRTKIQGYFKSQRSLDLWIYGIIVTQLTPQEQQPQGMPDYVPITTLEPEQSAQLS